MMMRRRKIHHETSEIYVREVLDGPIETNKKSYPTFVLTILASSGGQGWLYRRGGGGCD